MKQIFRFGVFQIKTILTSWKMTLFILVMPLLLLGGIGIVVSEMLQPEESIQKFQMAIVDHDDTFETKLVIKQLRQNDQIAKLTKMIQTEEMEATELLSRNKIAAMLVIPKGFSQDLKNGKNTPVKVVGNPQRPLQSQLVNYLIESAADYTSAAQSGVNTIYEFMDNEYFTGYEILSEFKKSVFSFSLHILGRGEIFAKHQLNSLFQYDIIQYYALSIYLLLLFIWCFSGVFLVKGNLNKSLRIRLLSRGITPFQISISDLLANFIMVTTLAFIIGIPLFLWLGLNPVSISVLLGIPSVILSFSALFIMLDSLFRNQQLYQIAGLVLIIFAAIAGGHFIPTIYLPDWLATAGKFTNNGWALKLLLSIYEQQLASSAYWTYLAYLISSATIFLLVTFLLKSASRGWWRT